VSEAAQSPRLSPAERLEAARRAAEELFERAEELRRGRGRRAAEEAPAAAPAAPTLSPGRQRALEELQQMPSVPKSLMASFRCDFFGHGPTGSVCIARQQANPDDTDYFYCTRGLCEQGKAVAKACGVEPKRWVVRQAELLRPAPANSGPGHFQHRRATSGVLATPAREVGPRIPSASERPPEVREVPAWRAAEERLRDLVPAKLAPLPPGAAKPTPKPKAPPWSKKGSLDTALGGRLEPTEELLEELAEEGLTVGVADPIQAEPEPLAAQPELTEEQVHLLVGPGPMKVRPLAKGERVTLKPGSRLFFVSTASPESTRAAAEQALRERQAEVVAAQEHARAQGVPQSPPIDIDVRLKAPLDLPVSPPPPAQPEKEAPMVAVRNESQDAEVKHCLRDGKTKLRPNNKSGICNTCRLELGSPDKVAAWLKEHGAEAAPARQFAEKPGQAAGSIGAPTQLEIPGTPASAALPDFRAAPNAFLLACLKQIRGEVQRRASEVAELTKAVSEFSAGE